MPNTIDREENIEIIVPVNRRGDLRHQISALRVDEMDTLRRDDEMEMSTLQDSVSFVPFSLYKDSYSMMMLSSPCDINTQSWWFGIISFVIQLLFLSFILAGNNEKNDINGVSFFNFPIYNPLHVSFSQLLAIIVTLVMTTDLVESVTSVSILLMHRRSANYNKDVIMRHFQVYQTVDQEEQSNRDRERSSLYRVYKHMVIWPQLLKFLEGLLALFTSFIIIMRSNNVIDLLRDLLALQIVSSIDNTSFWLCLQGVFGDFLHRKANKVSTLQLRDYKQTRRKCLPIFVMIAFVAMVIGWAIVLYKQRTGVFFHEKYPKCKVKDHSLDFRKIGDGLCQAEFNSAACFLDGGDCVYFSIVYPHCNQAGVEPWKVGDNVCDQQNNFLECKWDGGDCCPHPDDSEVFYNGVCNATLPFNSKICDFDKGECEEHNKQYPDGCSVPEVERLANGFCDGGLYAVKECNYDGGDCKRCFDWGLNLSLIGNGVCNGGEYSDEKCGFDGGDCDECIDLGLDPSRIGDGICDQQYNNSKCNFDGGDCVNDDPALGSDDKGTNDKNNVQTPSRDENGQISSNDDNGEPSNHETCERLGGDCLWTQLGDDIYGKNDWDESGISVSLNADGSIVAIGGFKNDVEASNGNENSGHVRLYRKDGAQWTQIGDDIRGANAGDKLGRGVSLSSDGLMVACGAFHHGHTDYKKARGSTQVFRWDESAWKQVGQTIYGDGEGDWSGRVLSLVGRRLAIGAHTNQGSDDTTPRAGHVRIFELMLTDGRESWEQIGDDLDGYEDSWFGYSVSLSFPDGSILAIGQPHSGDGFGAVEVYQYLHKKWELLGSSIPGKNIGDRFGNSVSISSNGNRYRLIIGAEWSDNGAVEEGDSASGYALVYELLVVNEDTTDWKQVGQKLNDASSIGDGFGSAVDISNNGERIAIGSERSSPNGSEHAGKVVVYELVEGRGPWDDRSWLQLGQNINGKDQGDNFGSSVSLSSNGDTLAIGARFNDNINGVDAGSVRIYSVAPRESN